MAWGWWKPEDGTPIVAIAVQTTGGHNTHVGMAYRGDDETDRLGLLHLAFHCLLEVEPPPPGGSYRLLVPNRPRAVSEAVATRCRATARSRPELRHGFLKQRDAYIDGEGKFFVEDDRGLNCSSFVLVVFGSVGVELVDEGSWKPREDDEHRFRGLWCQLLGSVRNRYGNNPNLRQIREGHVRKIAPDVTAVRVRPEETAGACLSESLPVGFQECEAHGETVRREIGCLS
jgi:hypothetical protein